MKNYLDKIEKILEQYPQYPLDAYGFVMAALNKTVAKFPQARHISGPELLEGIRECAIDQFGPLARAVLNHWGITKTEHFGEIVFALVDAGILRKQAEDRIEDFREVYSFEEVFDRSYSIPEE